MSVQRFVKIALLSLVLVCAQKPLHAEPFDVELTSKIIDNFQTGQTRKIFGKLEFIGGLEFTSPNSHVGAFSGISLTSDRKNIIAVTDTGFWFTSTIERNSDGKPIALKGARMAPILGPTGQAFKHKWNADAESIVLQGNSAFIAFERDNRVLRYTLDTDKFASLPEFVRLNIGVDTLRSNKGLETIAIAPLSGNLEGATLIISERSFNKDRNIRGAIINGPLKGLFAVKRKGKFDITDGAFLPNGDLVLLERRYNLARGVAMRIRHIKAHKIKPGAILKGKKLLQANGDFQIDNMEGLAVSTDKAGQIFLSLISDDNHSLLQRNLYLEFKLHNSGK